LAGNHLGRGYAGVVDTAYLVLLVLAFLVLAGVSLYALGKLFGADSNSSTTR
jgi:hypothetical protein